MVGLMFVQQSWSGEWKRKKNCITEMTKTSTRLSFCSTAMTQLVLKQPSFWPTTKVRQNWPSLRLVTSTSRDSGLTVWCPPLQCWRRVIYTLPSTGGYSCQSALMDQPTVQATDRPTPTKPAQIPTSSLLSTTLGEMAKDVPTRRRKVGTRSPGSSGVSFGSCPVSSWNHHQPKTHEAANKGQRQVKQLTMSRYLVTSVPKTTTHQRHVRQPTNSWQWTGILSLHFLK